MAKLPNSDKAIIPLEKFAEYALNPKHPSGRHKARVFQAALGLTIDDAEYLQEIIQEIVQTHDAIPEDAITYGKRYVIDFKLSTNVGSALIRTAWIVRYSEDFPRLTSCYILKD
jgi:hypothetical protein